MQHQWPERRGRTVRPDAIDRVGLGGLESGAGRRRGLRQFLGAGERVKPGVVAELGTRLEVILEPDVRRRIDQVLDRKNRAVDLIARLERVAAVDEQRRTVGEHDCHAGRAGKPGEPFEPLVRRRHSFVLLLVRTRQHEAVEPAPRELGAQRGNPRGDVFARRLVYVKGLELRLEHAGTLMGRSGRRQ